LIDDYGALQLYARVLTNVSKKNNEVEEVGGGVGTVKRIIRGKSGNKFSVPYVRPHDLDKSYELAGTIWR